MTLGNRIKIARKRLRMSQAVLARHTKVDQSSIAYWESGRTSPKYSRLMELAAILEVTPEWLQFGINSASPGSTVPVVATIGLPGCNKETVQGSADGFIEMSIGQNGAEHIAVAIRGSALAPAYMDGDVLIGERLMPDSVRTGSSSDYVIGLKDGRTLLARAPAGRNGVHNPVANPANVAWVMPIAWIRRNPVAVEPRADNFVSYAVNSEDTVDGATLLTATL